MINNLRIEDGKIFYTENGVEKDAELISVSIFPKDYPQEVQEYYKKYSEEETEVEEAEEISSVSETPIIEKIVGKWKLGENFQSEMENGFDPTIEILWSEMGLKPYDFNSRFEEISGRDIHDCLSEMEDGEDCPLYNQTVKKMRSEYREVEIDFSDCKYLQTRKYLVWSVDPDRERGFVEIEGLKIVNTTPHPINFLSEKTGREYQVEPCGFVLNATPEEEVVHPFGDERGEVALVRTVFKPSPEGLAFIESLMTGSVPGYQILEKIVVGSIIAAQAYPGRVVAMTPAKGFERVPPAEKRMNLFKYTIF